MADDRVSKKISHLVEEENVPQKQAVAMAHSMNRAGRLTQEGKYIRKGSDRGLKGLHGPSEA